MAQAFADVEDFLTCDICYNDFSGRDPRSLPCLHAFCVQCLQQVHSTALSKNPNHGLEIRCPSCQTTATFPDGDINNFPKYFQASQVQDMFHIIKKHVTTLQTSTTKDHSMCTVCSFDKLVAFCITCRKTFCVTCLQKHTANKRFSSHVKIKVTPEQVQSLVCPVHDEMVEAFCVDCLDVVCSRCQLIDHSDHDIRDFVVTEDLQPSQDDETLKLPSMEQINIKRGEFQEHVEAVHDQIEQHKQNLISQVEKQTSVLHDQLELHKKDIDSLFTAATTFSMKASKIQQPVSEVSCLGIENSDEIVTYLKTDIPAVMHEEFEKLSFSAGTRDVLVGYLSPNSEKDTKASPSSIEPSSEATNVLIKSEDKPQKSHSSSKRIHLLPGQRVSGVATMPNGDIIVIAENAVKMFTEDGTEKRMPFDINGINEAKAVAVQKQMIFVAIRSPGTLYVYRFQYGSTSWERSEWTIPCYDDNPAVTFTVEGDIVVNEDRKLYRYGINGNLIWTKSLPHTCLYMCVASENRFIVSYGDKIDVLNSKLKRQFVIPHKGETIWLGKVSGVCTDVYNNVYGADPRLNDIEKFDNKGKHCHNVTSKIIGVPTDIAVHVGFISVGTKSNGFYIIKIK